MLEKFRENIRKKWNSFIWFCYFYKILPITKEERVILTLAAAAYIGCIFLAPTPPLINLMSSIALGAVGIAGWRWIRNSPRN